MLERTNKYLGALVEEHLLAPPDAAVPKARKVLRHQIHQPAGRPPGSFHQLPSRPFKVLRQHLPHLR